jgi:raffinose/stachyose/melibiose transport system substrate-binding protein
MTEYYDKGRIYQGPSVLVPKTIPVFNYAQAIVLGEDPKSILKTMDADWARIAFRAPVVKSDASASAASPETEESGE